VELDRALGLAQLLDERVLQIVVPTPGRHDQTPFDFLDRLAWRLAARRVHDEVDARHRRLRKLHRRLDRAAAQDVEQDLLHAVAQRGVVEVAWHVDEAGVKFGIGILTQEQPDPLPMLQLQDAVGELLQDGGVDLKQLVSGVGFQNVQKRLGVMAVLGVARLLDHRVHLAAQERDVARAHVVGGRGQETQEAPLADDIARIVETAHADIVHIDRPVHVRPAPGLGDDEEFLALDIAGVVLGQRLGVPLKALLGHVAQNAQPLVIDDVGIGLVVAPFEAVLAVAQERELIGVQPLQKRDALVQVRLVDRRRRRLDLRDRCVKPLHHGAPVLDRRAHAAQDLGQARLDGGERLGRRLLGDLDMQEAFRRRTFQRRGDRRHGLALAVLVAHDANDRVDQHVNRQVHLVERRDDRVDQERHVVVDHLDGGMGGLPAVFLETRIVGADLRRARLAVAAELPQAGDGAEQVVERLFLDFLVDEIAEIAVRQAVQLLGIGGREPFVDDRDDPVDDFVQVLLTKSAHVVLPTSPLGPGRYDFGRRAPQRILGCPAHHFHAALVHGCVTVMRQGGTGNRKRCHGD
jgi:hypothetical protein